jgi:hypothetical protein
VYILLRIQKQNAQDVILLKGSRLPSRRDNKEIVLHVINLQDRITCCNRLKECMNRLLETLITNSLLPYRQEKIKQQSQRHKVSSQYFYTKRRVKTKDVNSK